MPCSPNSDTCAPVRGLPCGNAGTAPPHSLTAIVQAYRRDYRPDAKREHAYWATHTNLKSAVRAAALSKLSCGRRHPHQRRISGDILQRAADTLAKQDVPARCTFHDLHKAVYANIGCIHGIGELAVYDIAYRIGAFLGLGPDRVYLHAGTRKGAQALGLRGSTIPMRDLPSELRELTPAEVEDCLCRYKDWIQCLAI